MEVGGLFDLWWLLRMGYRVCMHIFFILVISPWQAQSMDERCSTGTNRMTPHSSSDGKLVSEGVVVFFGLRGEQWRCGGWYGVGCGLLFFELSCDLCEMLFGINNSVSILHFLPHSQKSPIFGIQLHFLMSPECSCIQGFYIVETKGLNINETIGGKVAIGPTAILAFGKVRDQSRTKKKEIFHDYKWVWVSQVISLDMRTCLVPLPASIWYGDMFWGVLYG